MAGRASTVRAAPAQLSPVTPRVSGIQVVSGPTATAGTPEPQ
ncbi:hypothetical protein ACIQPP_41115 [Streptomyces violaceusniger]|nr:hypothetical protein [Streptomyces hygroscopicus]